MGQREPEVCPTEEDGYRGKTKVGATSLKTKGDEMSKNGEFNGKEQESKG